MVEEELSIVDTGIKIFADGADLAGIEELAQNPRIAGFTTNPTLMRRSGVVNYESYARKVIEIVGTKPISFEVVSDDFPEMERQARVIASWGENIYVKVPVTNTRGESSSKVIDALSSDGTRLNVTALTTLEQVDEVRSALRSTRGAIISVFAGRIADTGRDPLPLMQEAVARVNSTPCLELLWASPREILNVCQAASIGCHIVTVTHDLLAKLDGIGRDLGVVSLDTVKMFHKDGQSAGYAL